MSGFNKGAFPDFDFSTLMQGMKMPGFDMSDLMDAQRRNTEALIQANQKVLEGYQHLGQKQVEIFQSMMATAQDEAQLLANIKSPEDAAKAQAELAKTAFENALSAMRELAEETAKANAAATSVFEERVKESLEELKKFTKVG